MNQKDVITHLQIIHTWVSYAREKGMVLSKQETASIEKWTADAIELLKEQEFIKPMVSVDTWICPKCGHTLESQELIDDKENPQVLVHELYEYCPNCGRKVKWE